MVLVRITPDRFGHLTLEPVSKRLRRTIVREVVDNGGPPDEDVYLQGDETRCLLEEIPKHQRHELAKGWPVRCRIDGWTLRRYFGYCSD